MDQPTPSQRFTATFSGDGNTITGRWEIAEDGTNYTTAAATPRAVT